MLRTDLALYLDSPCCIHQHSLEEQRAMHPEGTGSYLRVTAPLLTQQERRPRADSSIGPHIAPHLQDPEQHEA